MKTAKLTKIEFDKEWKSKDGSTFYQFKLEFDNGDAGCVSFKTREPRVRVGEQVSYEGPDGEYKKLKLQTAAVGGVARFAPRDPLEPYRIAASVAFNGAINLCSSGKLDIKDIAAFTFKHIETIISVAKESATKHGVQA